LVLFLFTKNKNKLSVLVLVVCNFQQARALPVLFLINKQYKNGLFLLRYKKLTKTVVVRRLARDMITII